MEHNTLINNLTTTTTMMTTTTMTRMENKNDKDGERA
jgi:hypothetical protein